MIRVLQQRKSHRADNRIPSRLVTILGTLLGILRSGDGGNVLLGCGDVVGLILASKGRLSIRGQDLGRTEVRTRPYPMARICRALALSMC